MNGQTGAISSLAKRPKNLKRLLLSPFKPKDGKPVPQYKPGQYIFIRTEVPTLHYLYSRQSSLSDAPHKDQYRISVKRESGRNLENQKHSPAKGTSPTFCTTTSTLATYRRSLIPLASLFSTSTTASPQLYLSPLALVSPLCYLFCDRSTSTKPHSRFPRFMRHATRRCRPLERMSKVLRSVDQTYIRMCS